MNGAVRAVVRMGIYCGCRVYFIKEVRLAIVCRTSTISRGPVERTRIECSKLEMCSYSCAMEQNACVHCTRRAGLQRARRGRHEHRGSHLGHRVWHDAAGARARLVLEL